MDEEQKQPKPFRGIPPKAQTTMRDKRAMEGTNLTEQARIATLREAGKYELRPKS